MPLPMYTGGRQVIQFKRGNHRVNPPHLTCRSALATTALSAFSYRGLPGANDRVQVAYMGYGLIAAVRHRLCGESEISGDAEASAMLECPYRKPWDTVLRGLLS